MLCTRAKTLIITAELFLALAGKSFLIVTDGSGSCTIYRWCNREAKAAERCCWCNARHDQPHPAQCADCFATRCVSAVSTSRGSSGSLDASRLPAVLRCLWANVNHTSPTYGSGSIHIIRIDNGNAWFSITLPQLQQRKNLLLHYVQEAQMSQRNCAILYNLHAQNSPNCQIAILQCACAHGLYTAAIKYSRAFCFGHKDYEFLFSG